jgi:hypothetical protein
MEIDLGRNAINPVTPLPFRGPVCSRTVPGTGRFGTRRQQRSRPADPTIRSGRLLLDGKNTANFMKTIDFTDNE